MQIMRGSGSPLIMQIVEGIVEGKKEKRQTEKKKKTIV